MFSEHRELISQLRQTDKHFEKLFEQHNILDQQIEHVTTSGAPCSNSQRESRKKEKLRLKDCLYAILQHKKELG